MGHSPEITYLLTLIDTLRRRRNATSRPGRCRGQIGAMTTETVIVVAGMAALALAVVAILVTKLTAKANSIPTD